jgi:hyperosmotically inducible periplasmic protein
MSVLHYGVSRPRPYAGIAFALTLFVPCASFAQNQQTTPDNSANNKAHSETADQQSSATSDRMLTKKIRQELIADKSLSTYGHNVKIITQNGMVTLKGPVHSEEEKQTIASKAAEVAGSADKVNNQLSIKQ